MARCNPGLRIHQNCGIKANVKLVFLNEFFAPSAFDVVFQLNAERAVIPGVCKAAVNFGAGINEAPAFAQRNERL
jgi:hypothetical protein